MVRALNCVCVKVFLHAPEILAQNMKQTPYTFASDVYAFGICVFELVAYRLPYRGYEDSQVVWQLAQGTLQPDYTYIGDGQHFDLLKTVSEWCISYRAGARPTFETVCFRALYRNPERCSGPCHPLKAYPEQANDSAGRMSASVTGCTCPDWIN